MGVADVGKAVSGAFHRYLDAKFDLDERSMAPMVRELFEAHLRRPGTLRCLDLGTGSGATFRRLLALDTAASFELVAVDRDPDLLHMAGDRLKSLLAEQEFRVTETPGTISGRRGERRVAARFVAADLADFQVPGIETGFDCVFAHHVMDLLPLTPMCERIHAWLAPCGLFYATLCYDGATALFPVYRDAELEARILETYDGSMEARRVGGAASGGARAGRRLHRCLRDAGFRIEAYAGSDWNLTPVRGAYRAGDALCIESLLEMIFAEALSSGGFGRAELEEWRRDRRACLAANEMGIIIHQLDLLAAKP